MGHHEGVPAGTLHEAENMSSADGGKWEIKLRDETVILVRRIEPEDAASIQRFYSRLSRETIYQRFFGPYPDLDGERARHFADLDGELRYALVALDPQNEDEIIGIARFNRDDSSEDTAEYAVVVEDTWQGKGLGTQLTRSALRKARERKINILYAAVQPENRRMVQVLQGLGMPELVRWNNGAERFEIDISED